MSYIPRSISVGDIIPTNNCGDIRIVEYKNAKHITVEFLNTGSLKVVKASSIKAGKVEDKMKPTFMGVGCIGEGNHPTRINGKVTREYSAWSNMIRRVYGNHPKYASYKDCTIHPLWLNFSTFCDTLPQLIGYTEWKSNKKECALDKDVLFIGNKEYGPFTCMFVDAALNSLESNIRRWRKEHADKVEGEAK
ncbi:hypothetical protein HAP90_17250 [Klebsiella quasipneumoniae subsp. similipneumoniae]|uniref:hypothetical protein n=1 Tax=Klebsiella quasipneumoniae TaxID=1463165 RepID=UPI000E2B472F|nr:MULTISPECIES: hypothetical protein [Klebsiella]NHJ29054.1 hypothetical protein [Klebsiella quasipneumoniae subsp. similipneumoniae]NHJ53357.1 hypothetical protein [Klebsiella quasipneumoniae subsp. similipneumoniae]NHJ66908.1 hypothetical protein [Klebsiella quasipneumoniae subsp. similipneumoniae]NHJ71852.1 hypothetical protein [Klebsiella quasipneumoniae subsp. similipneumoniae]NHJ82196.1 hypothetical protein [Klebsiella quasipneumoniae subsp. similipneumoniae]